MKSKSYGTWEVKIAIDEECSRHRVLGIFTGYVDEIAFYLASQGHTDWPLEFLRLKDPADFPKGAMVEKVEIQIRDPDYLLERKVRYDYAALAKEYLSDRPVRVEDSNLFQTVRLVNINYDEREALRQKAIAKLTDEELEVLGLKRESR